MLFQSPLFILFFIVVYALLCLLQERTRRHALLLASSYTFYAAWDIRFLSLLIISTLVDFVARQRIHQTVEAPRRRRWLVLSCLVNLGILGIFKYFNFFVGNAVDLAAALGITLSQTTVQIVLPIGISFYTFQSMSYSLDIYRGRMAPEPSLLRFALYVAFFPLLVAGPIVRACLFLPQLGNDQRPQAHDLPAGTLLFAIGLFKKIVVADRLGEFVDPCSPLQNCTTLRSLPLAFLPTRARSTATSAGIPTWPSDWVASWATGSHEILTAHMRRAAHRSSGSDGISV